MPRLLQRPSETFGPAAAPVEVGPWELRGLIGEGAFTRVYQARPARLAIAPGYALKVVRADRVGDATARALIAREARAAEAVAHPNLVAVFSSQCQGEPPYLVMPLLTGATLADRLAAGQRFSLPTTLAFIRQIAGALAALAERGYRHSDVKPGNVIVSAVGHATLIDLGFACQRDEEPSLDTRQWLGTPEYAAPERFISRTLVDPRSDIYSLGIVAYQLFAGRRPFEAATVADYAALHLHEPAPSLHAARPEIPRGVAALIQRMLAKDPLRRPTAAELVDELARREIDHFTCRSAAR